MNRQKLVLLGGVTVLIMFFLAVVWEFWLEERLMGDFHLYEVESAKDHWEYVLTATIFAGLSLIVPFQFLAKSEERRERAERNKWENERKYRDLVETSQDLIYRVDQQGRFIYLNPAWETTLGFSMEEMIGQPPGNFKRAEEAGRTLQTYKQILKGVSVTNYETTYISKSGEEIIFNFKVIPRIDGSGKIVGSQGTARDITERILVQQELARHREHLQDLVNEQTGELHQTNAQLHHEIKERQFAEEELQRSMTKLEETNLRLAEANRAKNQFLTAMSHELRTPLSAILGFSELLDLRLYGDLNEKQKKYVQQIVTSGNHLLDLINDLLDFSKIDAGAMELEPSTMDIVKVTKSTLNMMQSLFNKKQVSLAFNGPETPLVLKVDIRKFRQILLNLLSNALKYTDTGGAVTIAVDASQGQWARITIRDTGLGIPENAHKQIFTEFYQVDQTRDAALGGAGIGLALAKRLVEMHGGAIGVRSPDCGGSEFSFTLPLRSAGELLNKAPISLSTDAAPSSLPPKRILVVEDNEVNRKLIRELLSYHSYELCEAHTGKEALELAPAFKPELILMDIQMPVMDGLEATRCLRRMPEFAHIPIIALSAHAAEEDIKKGREAGLNEHLVKPINIDQLFSMMERLLG